MEDMNNNFRTIATFLFLIGGITVIVMTVFLIIKDRKRAQLIQAEIYALEQEKKQYEHDNLELQDKIAYLKSEHSYEKEAKKLNYKKPGEHVVIVRRSPEVSEENVDEQIGNISTKDEEEKHYSVWLSYFF